MTDTDKLRQSLGQRVLVSVNEGMTVGPPRMTTVRAFSPSGQFVWLCAAEGSTSDETVGWQHVARVRVLEVLGPAEATALQLETSLQAVKTTAEATPTK